MGFDYEAPQIGQNIPAPTPSGAGEIMVSYGKATLDVSVAASDLVGLCVLPKRCMPVGLTLRCPALDSGSTMAGTVGLAAVDSSSAVASTLASSTSMMTATTILRAGGVLRDNLTTAFLNASVVKDIDQYVTLKVTAIAAASSSSAVAGSIYAWLTYRAYDSREY